MCTQHLLRVRLACGHIATLKCVYTAHMSPTLNEPCATAALQTHNVRYSITLSSTAAPPTLKFTIQYPPPSAPHTLSNFVTMYPPPPAPLTFNFIPCTLPLPS